MNKEESIRILIYNGKIYIYTMEYYSAIKRNEMIPLAATQAQLEITILSEVKAEKRKRNTICNHLYVESKIRHK